jgi:hypothetical protein
MSSSALSENLTLKRELDAKKVEDFEASGRFKHGYSYDEWRIWNGNNYIKTHYDVLLPDGTIIEHCWANAGKLRKGFHVFDEHSNVKIRVSASYPA